MYSGVMPLKRYTTGNHIKKNEINYSSKMKKNYEKPCCSSMVVAVEQAMLAGSGVTVTDGGFTPQPPQTWSGAKQNSLPNEDDE
jgi:hypothetical protein